MPSVQGLRLNPAYAGVLAGILRAQQLDVHDIEGIHVVLQTLLEVPGAAPPACALLDTSNQDASAPPVSLQHPPPSKPIPSLPISSISSPSFSPIPSPPGCHIPSPPAARSPQCESQAQGCSPASGEGLRQDGSHVHPGLRVDPGTDTEHSAAIERLRAMPEADAFAALRNYLIAATAKDCAIMVTLQAGDSISTYSAGCSASFSPGHSAILDPDNSAGDDSRHSACHGPGHSASQATNHSERQCPSDANAAAERGGEGSVGAVDEGVCGASGVLKAREEDGSPYMRYQARTLLLFSVQHTALCMIIMSC